MQQKLKNFRCSLNRILFLNSIIFALVKIVKINFFKCGKNVAAILNSENNILVSTILNYCKFKIEKWQFNPVHLNSSKFCAIKSVTFALFFFKFV
jgi:hypothetical protein